MRSHYTQMMTNQQLFHLIHFLNGYTDYELHQHNLVKDLTKINYEISKKENKELIDKWGLQK